MDNYRCGILGIAFLICTLCLGLTSVEDSKGHQQESIKRFQELSSAEWKELFHDLGTRDWKENWTLDGLKAKVENSGEGMDFTAGSSFGNDSSHAVMWTKQSFSGAIKIDYEYTKLDETTRAVTILYILATGSGIDPYKKDIAEWSDLREVPSMRTYFNNMNTYHISYAAYGLKNTDPAKDYIRARRYMPKAKKGLKGTELRPDYFETGLFKTGVPHRITVIKKGNDLFMSIRTRRKTMLCHWRTDSLPPIAEGRIGLRHMYTRSARYRNFQVSVLNDQDKKAVETSSRSDFE